MKRFLVVSIVFVCSHLLANTCEIIGEAQIITQSVKRSTDNLTYCKAFPEEILQFNPSGVKPLSIEVVLDLGVEFPLFNGHDCEVPSALNGVLIQCDNKKIYLE